MRTRPRADPDLRGSRSVLTVGLEWAWLVVGLVVLVAAIAGDQLLDALAARRA